MKKKGNNPTYDLPKRLAGQSHRRTQKIMTNNMATKRQRSSIRRSTNADLAEIYKWLTEEKAQEVHGNFLCNWGVIQDAHEKGELLVFIDGHSRLPVAFQLNKLLSPGILQVRHAYRRQGIGKKMVKRCITINRKCDKCLLLIECKPSSSITFWKSMGFTLIESNDGRNYAYQVLDKKLAQPEKGEDVNVQIRFFPESIKWDINTIPYETHEPKAKKGEDNIIYFKNRSSFHKKIPPGKFFSDLVIEIKVNGKMAFFDKARYQEANAIGVRQCINGFYIDTINLNSCESGKGELFSPPPHTTRHAGPHRAVR